MKLTKKTVRQSLEAVFQELQSDIYDIPADVQFRMSHYLEKCKIHFICSGTKNSISEKINAKVIENIQNSSNNQIIITPHLYITQNSDNPLLNEVLFHEIMHLYAIGSCSQSDTPGLFLHQSGIERYHILDSNNITHANNCGFLNELLNDSVAAFLYNRLTGRKYHGNPQFSCLQFHNYVLHQLNDKKYSKDQLIRDYFSHNTRMLGEILLPESYKDFEQFDKKIYDCYYQNHSLFTFISAYNN